MNLKYLLCVVQRGELALRHCQAPSHQWHMFKLWALKPQSIIALFSFLRVKQQKQRYGFPITAVAPFLGSPPSNGTCADLLGSYQPLCWLTWTKIESSLLATLKRQPHQMDT